MNVNFSGDQRAESTTQRPPRWVRIVVNVAPLSGVVLGVLLAIAMARIMESFEFNGARVRWEQLPPPPELVERISFLSDFPREVYVTSATGATYRADIRACETPDETCWEAVAEAPPLPDFWGEEIDLSYPCASRGAVTSFERMAPPPGDSRVCARLEMVDVDIYAELYVHLLADGTLWYWRHSISRYSGWFECTYIPMGMLAGFMAGMILRWWWLERQAKRG